MAQQLEVAVVEQRAEVAAAAGEEIVDAEDLVALLEEHGAEMRAEEARPARHHDPLAQRLISTARDDRAPVMTTAP